MGDNQWSFSQIYFEDDVAEMNQNVPVRSKTCLILKEIVRSIWRPIIMLYGAKLALFHVKEIQKSFAAPPTIW